MVVGRVNWKYLYLFNVSLLSLFQNIRRFPYPSSATISVIARSDLSLPLVDQVSPDLRLASYWLSRAGVMVLFTRESIEPGKCTV